MTTLTTFTGKEALEALLPLGFVVDRETDRVFVSKGALKLTLPKGDQPVNEQLNKHLHGIIEDLKERAINSGRARRDNKMPLMVSINTGAIEGVYAVTEDRHTKWQVQDLDDGHRFEVLKIHARSYEPEPLVLKPPEETGPKFTVHQAPPEPEPEPAKVSEVLPPLLLTGNQSDLAALVRLTKRRMEGVKIEYEQVANRMAQLKEQYQAAALFLTSMGVEVVNLEDAPAGLAPAAPKHTVLPATHAPRSGGESLEDHWVDRVHMAWIDAGKPGGYGYMQKVKGKLQLKGEEMPTDQLLYRVMKKVYAKAAAS